MLISFFYVGCCPSNHGWLAYLRKQEIRSPGCADAVSNSSAEAGNAGVYTHGGRWHWGIQWIHGNAVAVNFSSNT